MTAWLFIIRSEWRDGRFAFPVRVFVDVFQVFFVPAATRMYGLFIFPHKICQQIRNDCPLQGVNAAVSS